MPDNHTMNDTSCSLDAPLLTISIDNQPQLEYDRSQGLPDNQLVYLDRMDKQMDAGIQIDGEQVARPDTLQRAQFVAVHLVEALQQGNEALIVASCAYLARRLPDLKQVKAVPVEAGFSLELVFDEPWVRETVVDFVPRPVS